MDYLAQEVGNRTAGVLIGLLFGAVVTAVIARWRRLRERRMLLAGDARESVVIHQHVVEPGSDGGPATLRVRSLGHGELTRVVPNGFLARELARRAHRVTPTATLISMDGSEGSYLLETLTNFVCDRVANQPFGHDLYVMAPCSEPAEFAEYQPVTVLLIRVADLALFADWAWCRGVEVEHGSDGARVLTMMELSRRYVAEQAELARRRAAGERTMHAETMYVLDLALDTRTAAVATKPVPWGRFAGVLKTLEVG